MRKYSGNNKMPFLAVLLIVLALPVQLGLIAAMVAIDFIDWASIDWSNLIC